MAVSLAHWRARLILPAHSIVVALALLPAIATADSRVQLKATIEPTYPVADQEFRLRVQVADNSGRPLDKAQVIATLWMNPRQYTGMAMTADGSGENPIRLVGRPQATSGEYLFTLKLPMNGRWRSQVWVNASGATGTIPLDFDVVAQPPPGDTSWPLVASAAAIIALGSMLAWWRALKPRSRRKPANLLSVSPVHNFLRSRWYPAVLQWPTLAVFFLIIYFLLAGSSEVHDNLGSALTWVVWWPLLPLIFLLFGRLWCAVCPMSLLSDLSQRVFGRRLPVPASLKRRGPWLVLAAFLTITWADLVLGLVEVPVHTAALLLLVTAGVVCCGLIFERRAWCRYLCPIGGLSGNYAMAATLELRADENICRDCRSFACVRGDGRTAGCPMFEFPRTMASNHHCNLCGNCLKACPSGAIRLSPRSPGDELGFARRGRWYEAILAAALLGAVALQSVVMLGSSFPALAGILGGGHGGGNPLALTALFLALTVFPLATFGLASVLSAPFSRRPALATLLHFAYALIPLGLTSHLAHNLNHLLSEGRSVANAALGLFGQPAYASPVLASASTVRSLQYALVIGGTLTSMAICWRLAGAPLPLAGNSRGTSSKMENEGGRVARRFASVPLQLLIGGLAAGLLVLFGQDMAPRLQLSAEAHDTITAAQIATAKSSVAAFLGRSIPLEYVHLEVHGYRDIILRNADNYYFVDMQNMQVSSMFSSRFRPIASAPMPKATAQQMAGDFANQHYPNFSRNNLQPARGPEESSPYQGGYVFEWRQYIDGVAGPNYVKVTTDAFGVVAIYAARDVPLTAPIVPAVTRELAITIAEPELDLAPRAARAALDIGPEITGRQILRWTVTLEGELAGMVRRAEVVVDASSGEVLSVLKWS